jgi:hypothetical protein
MCFYRKFFDRIAKSYDNKVNIPINKCSIVKFNNLKLIYKNNISNIEKLYGNGELTKENYNRLISEVKILYNILKHNQVGFDQDNKLICFGISSSSQAFELNQNLNEFCEIPKDNDLNFTQVSENLYMTKHYRVIINPDKDIEFLDNNTNIINNQFKGVENYERLKNISSYFYKYGNAYEIKD